MKKIISIKCKKKMCFWPWQNNHREQIAKNAGSTQNHCDKRVDAGKLKQLKEDYLLHFMRANLNKIFHLFLQMVLSCIVWFANLHVLSIFLIFPKEVRSFQETALLVIFNLHKQKMKIYFTSMIKNEKSDIILSRKKVLDKAGLAKVLEICLI